MLACSTRKLLDQRLAVSQEPVALCVGGSLPVPWARTVQYPPVCSWAHLNPAPGHADAHSLTPCSNAFLSCARRSTEDQQVDYHECVDEHEWYCHRVSIGTVSPTHSAFLCCSVVWFGGGVAVLLMSVRTDDTRFINRAFTLASSRCPKPGSAAPAVQPTIVRSQQCLAYMRRGRFRMGLPSIDIRGQEGWWGRRICVWADDVLRARNRSSERIAIALMRRTATALKVSGCPCW